MKGTTMGPTDAAQVSALSSEERQALHDRAMLVAWRVNAARVFTRQFDLMLGLMREAEGAASKPPFRIIAEERYEPEVAGGDVALRVSLEPPSRYFEVAMMAVENALRDEDVTQGRPEEFQLRFDVVEGWGGGSLRFLEADEADVEPFKWEPHPGPSCPCAECRARVAEAVEERQRAIEREAK
jgi:hypothetical protein